MEVRTQDGACCHRVICTQPAAQLDAVATKLHCGQGARVCVEVRVRVHVRVHVRIHVRVHVRIHVRVHVRVLMGEGGGGGEGKDV